MVWNEIDRVVVTPRESPNILIEIFRVFFFLPVRLVTVTFHAFPSHEFSIGGDHLVLIVTHHPLCKVAGFTGIQIVKIEVRVGRSHVSDSLFFTGHVDYSFSVFGPCDLFCTAPRTNGWFPFFSFHDVFPRGNHLARDVICHERMGVSLYPVIPVTIYLTVDQAGVCLRKIGVKIVNILFQFHVFQEKKFGFVRGENKAPDTAFDIG